MPTPGSDKNQTSPGAPDVSGQTPATTDAATQGHGGVAMNASLPSLPTTYQVDAKRLLWVGGLVAVGVLGVIEWPVVAAVGVGSYVAEQLAKGDVRRGSDASGHTGR